MNAQTVNFGKGPRWRVWMLDGPKVILVKEFFDEDRTAADRYAWEQLCDSKRDVTFLVRKEG